MLCIFRSRSLFANTAWRASEEARRIAVEEALEDLLARDTQYRKELSLHLESKMETAERRRKSRKDQEIKVIPLSN